MDPKLAEAIGGAYQFASNILFAVITDLLDQPDGQTRAVALLERLDARNANLGDTPVAERAMAEIATLHAAVRQSRQQ